MEKVPLWKPLLIIAIIAFCAYVLHPIERTLKPGPDLAGGTTLVYQVDTASGGDAKQDIEDTIAVLRNRVDPLGQRNLIWRPTAGSRIEILMPHASTETRDLRRHYTEARDALLSGNLSRTQLEAALRSPEAERSALFRTWAGGHPDHLKVFEDVSKAYADLEAARVPYNEAQRRHKALEASVSTQPTTSPFDSKITNPELISSQHELTRRTRAFIAARDRYNAAIEAALVGNVDSSELDRLFAMPKKPVSSDPNAETFREKGLHELIAKHPTREAALRHLATNYEAYEAVKGALEDPSDLQQLLKGSGVLEFRIAPAPGEVADLQTYRDQLREKGIRGVTGTAYRWLAIDDPLTFADGKKFQEAMMANPEGYFASRGLIAQRDRDGETIYMLLHNTPDAAMMHGREAWALTDAFKDQDQRGYPAVSFRLNAVGGRLMGQLTTDHTNKPMAIVLDGRVISAPNINEPIHGSGIITGRFDDKEISYLVRTLKAGSLKARLSDDPISIETTGPTFGKENLDAGLRAAWWATGLICAFMLIYYWMLGFVAVFALVVNIVLTLAVMAMTHATFTLSGIAGIILTIGLAVDSNVLIYERIREEQLRKASVQRAVKLGFEKAFATIIDSHITTLITCVILFYTATADVKGFAVALGIGLVANLFTSVFCSRVIVDLYIQIFKPHSIKTLTTEFPAIHRIFEPNIDWVGKRYFYVGISAVLTLGGLVGIWVRGADFLDIEFRSGTQVTFEFANDPATGKPRTLTAHEVRKRLEEVAATDPKLKPLADATPVTVGAVEDGKASTFTIQTLLTDERAVSRAVKTAFSDLLEETRPLKFVGSESKEVLPEGIVRPIKVTSLGVNIGRPEIETDVSAFLGGVVIVLDQLEPATTTQQISDRIGRMQSQPGYESGGYRPFTVIGLDLAPGGSPEKPLYRSVAVVARDERTNYADETGSGSITTDFTNPQGLAATEWKLVHDATQQDTSLAGVTKFDSQISTTMKNQAIVAVILSWLMIMAYIWFRFGSLAYGAGAVLALIHDVITAIGLAALTVYFWDTAVGRALLITPLRVDLAMVAAALTLIGYSVNDTIVVFDRIRENRGRLAYASPKVINDSINQTISRSVLTVATVLIAVLAMYVVGGPGIHGFSFVMLVGALVGCYSSIAVASPILLFVRRKEKPHSTKAAETNLPSPTT
ncbi:MAG: protein translocase subunit SecD [Phycisphaeraceae bacterium]|nr:protein translocase subunit SecD [Phycisphaeraceae bacterium]